MRTLVLVVLLASALISVLVVPAFAYDWITSPVNGHWYKLVDAESWARAEAQAVVMGGHLATIRNAAENDWLQPWLAGITGPTQWWAWTGFYQLPNSPEPDSGWVWVSGEPVIYTNWSYREPNDYYGSGDPENWCGYYIRVQAPRFEFPTCWLDVRNEPSVGIVEIVPEPSALVVLGAFITSLALLKRRR